MTGHTTTCSTPSETTGYLTYHREDRWSTLMSGPIRRWAETTQADLDLDVSVRRGWHGGPHLALTIRGPRDALASAMGSADAMCRSTVSRLPSDRHLNASDVAHRVEDAAHRDGITDLPPWRPDNTLVWEQPAPAPALDELDSAIHENDYRATIPALRMLASATDTPTLYMRALDLLAATAHTYAKNGLNGASRSFASHAEAYIALRGTENTRTEWDRALQSLRPHIEKRLPDAIATTNPPVHVHEWMSALTSTMDEARDGLETGRITMPTIATGFSTELTAKSRWHASLSKTTDFNELLAEPWFHTYRLALNLAYLQLTRLGVQPGVRHFLCYAIATTIHTPQTQQGESHRVL